MTTANVQRLAAAKLGLLITVLSLLGCSSTEVSGTESSCPAVSGGSGGTAGGGTAGDGAGAGGWSRDAQGGSSGNVSASEGGAGQGGLVGSDGGAGAGGNAGSANQGGASSGGANADDLVITDLRFSFPLRVDEDLTILGRNFGAPLVWLDDTQVTSFRRFGDNELVLIVPGIAGLLEPRLVTLRVLNPITGKEAYKGIVVYPPTQYLIGDVEASWLRATPEKLRAGEEIQLVFGVRSEASLDGMFRVEPILLGPAWSVDLEVLDESGVKLANREFLLKKGERREFSVRWRLPAASEGTRFDLGAVLYNKTNRYGTTALYSFVVGESAPVPDASIEIESPNGWDRVSESAPADSVTYNGSEFSVRRGYGFIASFNLRLPANAEYLVEVSAGAETTGWEVALSASSDSHYPQQNSERTPVSRVVVRATSTASVTGDFTFRVRKPSDPYGQIRRFRLKRFD